MLEQAYESKTPDSKGYVEWEPQENNTWKNLVERQEKLLPGTACHQFIEGLEYLNFTKEIPQIPELNKMLDACNGWGVEPVPAIIQPREFFELLSKKRFPAATFIRRPEDMDYLQEPDIFHEVFGHTPLLVNKAYGDFMEQFGSIALKAEPKDRRRLFRLFWFTIEFGLVKVEEGLRAYGGGILSSPGETAYCLTDKSEKQPFNVLDALRTPYRIDIMQPFYFVLERFDDLFTILDQDILGKLQEAKELGDYEPKFPPKVKKAKLEDVEENEEDEEENGAMKC